MEISSFLIFDYVIFVILGLSIYIGWRNGLIRSFIAFFAWFGSIIIVIDNYSWLYSLVNEKIHSKFISGFIASIGFYIILVIGFSLLGDKISKTAEKFGGSTTDKITGGVFGSICGALMACFIFWVIYISFFTLNDQKLPEWLSKAKTYKVLKLSSDTVTDIISSEEERKKLLDMIKNKGHSLENEVKKNINTNKSDEVEE
ncbi:MAG: CvpA family protein [Pseudomonadota bacterium]